MIEGLVRRRPLPLAPRPAPATAGTRLKSPPAALARLALAPLLAPRLVATTLTRRLARASAGTATAA